MYLLRVGVHPCRLPGFQRDEAFKQSEPSRNVDARRPLTRLNGLENLLLWVQLRKSRRVCFVQLFIINEVK